MNLEARPLYFTAAHCSPLQSFHSKKPYQGHKDPACPQKQGQGQVPQGRCLFPEAPSPLQPPPTPALLDFFSRPWPLDCCLPPCPRPTSFGGVLRPSDPIQGQASSSLISLTLGFSPSLAVTHDYSTSQRLNSGTPLTDHVLLPFCLSMSLVFRGSFCLQARRSLFPPLSPSFCYLVPLPPPAIVPDTAISLPPSRSPSPCRSPPRVRALPVFATALLYPSKTPSFPITSDHHSCLPTSAGRCQPPAFPATAPISSSVPPALPACPVRAPSWCTCSDHLSHPLKLSPLSLETRSARSQLQIHPRPF